MIFGGAVEDTGHSGSSNGFSPQASDTWILSNANGTSGTPQWQQLTESNPPPARGGSTSTPAVVTDSINSRMTIFGGFHFGAPSPGVSLNDTWVLNALGVPVTVTSNPSGLAVLVQSASQTAPYTFLCASGGNSTIGVNSPQSAGANQQYAFNNWNDNSVSLSRIIACPASPATYTANFSLQDRVTLATNPAGVGLTVNLDGTPTSTPASPFLSLGNYTLGVTLPQAGATGIQYAYSSWSDAARRLILSMRQPVWEGHSPPISRHSTCLRPMQIQPVAERSVPAPAMTIAARFSCKLRRIPASCSPAGAVI